MKHSTKTLIRQYNIFVVIVIIAALEAILFLVGVQRIEDRRRAEDARLAAIAAVFDQVQVKAKAFSIYDATADEKLYGRGDDAPLPLASLAKIMTIVTTLNYLDPSHVITLSHNAIAQEGDYGLKEGEKWKVGDLATLTLIVSANDGAYALAENVPDFLDKVNQKAQRLGLSEMTFKNPTGLDIDDHTAGLPAQAGAFASAADVNTLALFAYKDYPSIFSRTVLPSITLTSDSGLAHTVKNTDVSIGKIPNLLFSKTGFTDIAGGNLCVIFRNSDGHEIAVTVMGSTFDGRFADMEKIVNLLYSGDYGSMVGNPNLPELQN